MTEPPPLTDAERNILVNVMQSMRDENVPFYLDQRQRYQYERAMEKSPDFIENICRAHAQSKHTYLLTCPMCLLTNPNGDLDR